MPKLLIGETQEDLATAMNDFFSLEHYSVQLENNGWRILESLGHNQYDVIVLEIALPGLDGIDIVRRFRSTGGKTPILLIASQHSSKDLRSGLNAGADAYLVKPFRLHDVAAQLKALLRRPELKGGKMLRCGDILMDTEIGKVSRNDIPIHLHPMEFKLLQFLLDHPNQVFNAHALFERVWQKDNGSMESTVRTHVRTLRRKLDVQDCESIITTVRGFGYKINEQSSCESTHQAISDYSEELGGEESFRKTGNQCCEVRVSQLTA